MGAQMLTKKTESNIRNQPMFNGEYYKGWSMVLPKYQRAFGVFTNSSDLERAIEELKAAGLPMSQVSVIAPASAQVDPIASYKAQERTNIGAIAGGTVGGTIGLILGLGTAAVVPIVGPIALLGVAATTLATTLTSGVIGATVGGLAGALINYGIPSEQAKIYSDRIDRGDYFIIIEAIETDIRVSEAILSRHNIEQLRIYDITEPSTTLI